MVYYYYKWAIWYFWRWTSCI